METPKTKQYIKPHTPLMKEITIYLEDYRKSLVKFNGESETITGLFFLINLRQVKS